MSQAAPAYQRDATAAPTLREAMAEYWQREAARRKRKIHAEIRRRVELRAWAEADPARQAAVLEGLRRDPARLFDDWFWTYDPRNVDLGLPSRIPFRLRPKQRECIRWLQERKRTQTSGLIEKSRDEGASFLVCGDMVRDWLLTPGYAGVVGSRKQELVDHLGDPKTLFAKIRTLLYSLPRWMLPEGFARKHHDNFLRLLNPDTDASITGEGGDNMGRGGRASVYFIDEWAFVDRADSVNAAVSQNSNVRIKVTTPNGPGNAAYRERFSGQVAVFTLHWKDNPAKNSFATIAGDRGELEEIYPWYEIQKASPEMTEATLAQEVDIDWTASVEGVMIPAKWVRAAVGFPLSEGAIRQAGADVGGEGRDGTFYAARAGGRLLRCQEITRPNPGAQASDAEELATADGVQRLFYDRLGIGSGWTATLKRREAELPFQVIGVANSEAPTERVFADRPEVPASERFKNLAAELWWTLRLRFWRTYQRAQGLARADEVPDDECISIPPGLDELVAQLSQPTYHKNSKDKIVVDKRGEGGKSPDQAEAVMYAFTPDAVVRRRVTASAASGVDRASGQARTQRTRPGRPDPRHRHRRQTRR